MSTPVTFTGTVRDSAKRYEIRAGAPSPIVLTDRELLNEAHALIDRIAHSSLLARDAMLVAEMWVRLARLA